MSAEFLKGLDDSDFDNVATSRPAEKITFPCEICGGSGKVEKTYGYSPMTRRTYVNNCKACQGRGSFTTSADVRKRNRANTAARKVAKVEELQAAFSEAWPGLIDGLKPCAEWSEFARSLCDQFATRGTLTERQAIAAASMVAKVAEKEAARKVEKDAATVGGIDLAPIRAAFATATEAGHKRPTYRAEGLTISRAPDHGRNAGALYVKDGGEYSGKIIADTFQPVHGAAQDIGARLLIIAADPKGAAIKYGNKTGACSCCGRELTRADSIAAGIGPICAGKWGF